jgi:hypothetical protein
VDIANDEHQTAEERHQREHEALNPGSVPSDEKTCIRASQVREGVRLPGGPTGNNQPEFSSECIQDTFSRLDGIFSDVQMSTLPPDKTAQLSGYLADAGRDDRSFASETAEGRWPLAQALSQSCDVAVASTPVVLPPTLLDAGWTFRGYGENDPHVMGHKDDEMDWFLYVVNLYQSFGALPRDDPVSPVFTSMRTLGLMWESYAQRDPNSQSAAPPRAQPADQEIMSSHHAAGRWMVRWSTGR